MQNKPSSPSTDTLPNSNLNTSALHAKLNNNLFQNESFETVYDQNNTNNEIFHEEEKNRKINTPFYDPMTWVKANFFLTDQRVLFGTWNGVFTTIILNVFGVIMYLRSGWMVANFKHFI